VHGREDLHPRPEERVVADTHAADVEHDELKLKKARSPSSMFAP
jgi:hypothetical protein